MKDFKLIVYELNEVPRKLIDYYVNLKPNSNLKKIISDGIIINTFTKDDGELHPWSTWPTVHRGVCNKIHNIRYINQDLKASKEYKPIWEILSDNDKTIGIFGSLQSYPPYINKNVYFYLPDTFAPDSKAYPEEISEFQSLNLSLVSDNKAVSRQINRKQIINFCKLLVKNTISIRSSFKTFIHITKELLNKKYKTRRAVLQTVISFDLYLKSLEKTKPQFSTYFTNHLAGMMHRYWKHLFPEDFNDSKKNIDKFHSKSILKAMDIVDYQLGRLINFSKKNGYDLWIISSMGQKAIERKEYIPELFLQDLKPLINVLNLDEKLFNLVPAMQPDICITSKDKSSLDLLRKSISNVKDSSGNKIFIQRYEPIGLTLNLSLYRSADVASSKNIYINNLKYQICDIGLELISRDIGTAYHCPEGIFILNGDESLKTIRNIDGIVDTCKIAPTILRLFDIKKTKYMMDEI